MWTSRLVHGWGDSYPHLARYRALGSRAERRVRLTLVGTNVSVMGRFGVQLGLANQRHKFNGSDACVVTVGSLFRKSAPSRM
jgi:hypothetical protein